MIYENGKYRPLTSEEYAARKEAVEQEMKAYWRKVDYSDAVDAQIRRRYSVSQEFALLRQREQKPEEYRLYYDYCEECKTYVKEQMAHYREVNA